MKDDLFKQISKGPFCFDSQVANVFEDMLERSIPFYKEVMHMTVELMLPSLKQKQALLYDLGCSHGSFLYAVIEQCNHKGLSLIGVDASKPMIEKAKQKLDITFEGSLELIHALIEEIRFRSCAGIVMHYTLQFINPLLREDILQNIYDALMPGGMFVLSEKVIGDVPMLNEKYICHYHDFKKRMGYSQIEIERKQKALQNVLIPFTSKQYVALLEKVGFTTVDIFFRWYNFISYVAIKEKTQL